MPLDVETIIPEFSEVLSFLEVMEGINLKKYFDFRLETRVRNSYDKSVYDYVDIALSTELGEDLKKQRCIQVEGAFGVIKKDMKIDRFTRRGMNNA